MKNKLEILLRARAKATTQKMIDLSLDGRFGIIIDAQADKLEKNSKFKKCFLHLLGYDCYMIFVNTSLDVALERNHREKEVCQSL